MAITARFQADFASFYDAVTKAEVKLVDFSKGAGKVESALNRMTDSFSGRKVIQEAALMEKAIGGVSGLSRLTETELRKVGSTAAEAIEKMKKLGIDVPPGLQKIAEAGAPVSGMFGKIMGALGPLGPLVASTFTIGAVVGFGKAIVGSADALVKLHDKTGIVFGGLQELQAIGRESGNSFEQITDAISKMQDRIASGDTSALAAFKDLGLSFTALRAMSPDMQFRAIGAAIREVEDPAERVRLAMDAFGRSGAEILPTLLANMDAIAAGTVKMSDETIRALDEAGDAWDRLVANTKASVANSVTAFLDYRRARVALIDNLPPPQFSGLVPGQVTRRPLSISEAAAAIGMPTPAQMASLDFDLAQLSKRVSEKLVLTEKAKAAADRIAAANLRWNDSVRHLTSSSVGAERSFGAIGRLMPDLIGNTGDWQGQLALLGSRDLPLVVMKLQEMGGAWKDFTQLPKLTTPFDGLTDLLQGINSDFAQMATVATRAYVQIKGTFTTGSQYYDANATAAQRYTTAATLALAAGASVAGQGRTGAALSGAASGAAIGGTVAGYASAGASAGPIGAGVGAIAGAVVGLVMWYKKNNAHKEVNQLRDAFIGAAGGLDQLNRRAHGAGAILNRLLDAKKPAEYKAAIDELNAAFAFQDHAMAMLNTAIEKYGFSIEQLGPTLSKQKLDEQAAQLITDFRLLERAGIDVNNISIQMSSSINEYLKNAIKTGTTVPEHMREILNQLATMGLLTDENGNLISDLETAGVTFAQTLDDQFTTLIGTIQKLTDAIARGLGLAIENVPDVNVGVNVERPNRDVGDLGGAVPMARGGRGRVTKPTLFLAGESGAEDFAFSGGGRRFGRTSAAAAAPVTVNIYGGRFNTPSDRLRAANEISQALMDEQRLGRRLNVA